MTTKTKKIWKLKDYPTTDDLVMLITAGVMTKEEAKEIVFTEQTEEDRDKKSLESEIKFLREVVTKLSNGQTTRIIETIREVQKPYYYQQPWWNPYQVWCGTATVGANTFTSTANDIVLCGTAGTTTNLVGGFATAGLAANSATPTGSFSSIKTF